MDYGARFADKRIAAVDKKVKRTFRTAQRELKEKLSDFAARFEEKCREKKKAVADGLISMQEYRDWLTGQVFMRNQWQSKIKQVNATMLEHTRQAAQIVRENKFDVFAENYNFAAFQTERGFRGVSFNLYNAQSVSRLVRDDPKILPEWKIDEQKDYKWNYKKVNNIVQQGIIQGESVSEITDRLCRDLSTMNANRMELFARTAITGAQNAGRRQQMEDAAEMGLEVKKQWLATMDNRTRDAHRELDGQEVPFDQPFVVNWDGERYEIDYPGDPDADPCMVYNCRCTMVTVYPKHGRSKAWRETQEINGQSYQDWKAGKRRTEEEAPKTDKQDEIVIDDSFDIFSLLDQDEDETEVVSEDSGVLRDSNSYGDFGIANNSYPEELRYTEAEQEFVTNTERHYHDEPTPRDFEFDSDIADALRPSKTISDNEFKLEMLERQVSLNEQKHEEAERMIAQRKAEGYHGRSRQESFAVWKQLQEEIRGADETEIGAVLEQASIGKSGIQFWQRQRKETERRERQLEFARKIIMRERYALENGRTGWRSR